MVRDFADIKRETKRYPDAELNRYINASNRKLHSILERYGLVRDEAVYTVPVDGSASYTLPADHYRTLKVWYDNGSGDPCELRRATYQTRPHAAPNAITGIAREYRVAKSSGARTIELWPRPTSGTYLVSYVQKLADLVDDSSELVSSLGYDDEFVAIDAAIKCLRKEGSKTTDLERDRTLLVAQIVEDAQSQEEDDSFTIRDVAGHSAHDVYDDWKNHLRGEF